MHPDQYRRYHALGFGKPLEELGKDGDDRHKGLGIICKRCRIPKSKDDYYLAGPYREKVCKRCRRGKKKAGR